MNCFSCQTNGIKIRFRWAYIKSQIKIKRIWKQRTIKRITAYSGRSKFKRGRNKRRWSRDIFWKFRSLPRNLWCCSKNGLQTSFQNTVLIIALHSQRKRYNWVGRDGLRKDCSFCNTCNSKTIRKSLTILCPYYVSNERTLRINIWVIWGNRLTNWSEICCIGWRSWHGFTSCCSSQKASCCGWNSRKSCWSFGKHKRVPFEEIKVFNFWWSRQIAEYGFWKTNKFDIDINSKGKKHIPILSNNDIEGIKVRKSLFEWPS